MAIISDSDLAAFLGNPALVGDAQAIKAAALASGAVQAYLGTDIGDDPVTETDLVLDGPAQPSRVIILPGYPISALSALSSYDWATETWYEYDSTRYQWNSAGVVVTEDHKGFPAGLQNIKVSYVHGASDVPPAVQAVALGMAARAYENPVGLQGATIGGISYTYGRTTSANMMALDPAEMMIIARFMDRWVG